MTDPAVTDNNILAAELEQIQIGRPGKSRCQIRLDQLDHERVILEQELAGLEAAEADAKARYMEIAANAADVRGSLRAVNAGLHVLRADGTVSE